eukprot:TRINITY_DN55014_c0_g1_i1.p1 TRINITY_DN55014_c0_g1~~TRINITY_DN55014_c0_g1_i1.p1  ORF type:complete len:461 (+),score=72.73 TRINITY_DN55014_c0_g1_i1:118-1383(+)
MCATRVPAGVPLVTLNGCSALHPDVNKVMNLLKPGSPLKEQAIACFKVGANGRPSLDLQGLSVAVSSLASAIALSPHAFGDLREDFIRFDFDGDGSIEEHEWLRLLRCRLRRYIRTIAPKLFELDIPHDSEERQGLHLLRKLGEGSFGQVSLVVDAEGQQRCLKKIPKGTLTADGLEELKFEYEVMHKLDNFRIAKTFGIFQDHESINFLNEPYFGGDLNDVTKRARTSGVAPSEGWFQRVFRQCLEGVKYMHENAMMHCDIKEANIMLRTVDYDEPEVVIIDYGLSREFTSDCHRLVGTPGYIPPETWLTGSWFPRGDCFSIGVVMLQMLLGLLCPQDAPIFAQGATTMEQLGRVVASRPPPLALLEPKYPASVPLVASLLQKERPERPTALQALKQAWLESASGRHIYKRTKRKQGCCC